MAMPLLTTRVKEPNHPARYGISSAQVAALKKIAVLATPGAITSITWSSVFLWDDMLKVERYRRKIIFMQSTVFATMARSLRDQVAKRRSHYEPRR
jgi:hypothetical protein